MDRKLDLERIAKVIRDAKPDIVALQEVDNRCSRSGGVDQTAELARLTSMTGYFGRAMDFGGGQYGQAILSRHPVASTKVYPLPGSGEPRIAFEALVSWNGSQIRFVSLHLDLDETRRLQQAQALVGLLEKHPEPLVVCGDFNDKPGSATLETFVKAFQEVPKSPPPFTFPADNPSVEIDFFFTQKFHPVSPAVVLAEAVASDHRPLRLELQQK